MSDDSLKRRFADQASKLEEAVRLLQSYGHTADALRLMSDIPVSVSEIACKWLVSRGFVSQTEIDKVSKSGRVHMDVWSLAKLIDRGELEVLGLYDDVAEAAWEVLGQKDLAGGLDNPDGERVLEALSNALYHLPKVTENV